MTTVQYSIISRTGLHYRDCDTVWEAFRRVRRYSNSFYVQRQTSSGHTTWFDRLGTEIFRGSTSKAHPADCQCSSSCWDGPLDGAELNETGRREAVKQAEADLVANGRILNGEWLPASEREASRVWIFHQNRCETCSSGARCFRGEILVHNLIQTQRAAQER